MSDETDGSNSVRIKRRELLASAALAVPAALTPRGLTAQQRRPSPDRIRVGIVGAGGIGGALNTSIARYEYGTTAAIIIVIVALVYLGEYASGVVRKRVQ